MATEISDWNDLDNVRNDLTGDYVLVNDLNSDTDGYAGIGDDFEPIGFVSGTRDGDPFSGVLDGDGFQISDLVIEENDSSEAGVAFITQVGNGGLVENLSVDGTVNSTVDDFFYGGLAASVGADGTGTIENCVSHVDVTSDGNQVGGLVGRNLDTVTESNATGEVEGDEQVGGLAGRCSSGTSLDKTYSLSDVTGGDFVGGLYGAGFTTDVSESYAVGNVTGDTNVGGFAGASGDGDRERNYFDTEATTQSDAFGTSDGGGGVTSLTTAEMQGSEAETNMDGFDFANTWDSVVESDNDTTADGYPILLVLDREQQLDAQGILSLTAFTISALVNSESVEIQDIFAQVDGEVREVTEASALIDGSVEQI